MPDSDAPTRDQLVAALHDMLAVVTLESLPTKGAITGLPGVWSPRPNGVPGARVELAADEHVLVNGVATSRTVDIDLNDPAVPGASTVTLDAEHSIIVWFFPDAAGGETWVGLTSSSAPRLQTFAGISAYPDDERWRLPVSFSPPAEDEQLSTIGRMRGSGPFTMARAGWFTTTVAGEQYRLSVDFAPAVDFRDAGSGKESYGAGRVLRLQQNPEDVAVLDFNQSAVPPCAINPLINCPVPPESNVIRSVVRAGQRDVHFDQAD